MPRIILKEARDQISAQEATFAPGASDTQKNAAINAVLERFITGVDPTTNASYRGTLHRLNLTGSNNIITLPWMYDRVDAVAVSGADQVLTRNQWFEFLGAGSGVLEDGGTGNLAFQDMGDGFCTIFDPDYTFYVRVTTELAGPAGVINMRGLDANGAEVFTTNNAEKIRGINITTPTTAGSVTGSQVFSKLQSLVKPATNGRVSIYAVNASTAAAELIGVIMPGETAVSWRRYALSATYTNDTADDRTYVVLTKLAHRLLSSDYDLVVPGHLGALVNGVRALNYEAKADDNKANMAWARAFSMLESDLAQYMGSAFTGRVKMQYRAFAGGTLTNLV